MRDSSGPPEATTGRGSWPVMLDTQPNVIFLHYWGTGPADTLATGFKAALDQLGKAKASQ